MPSKLNISIIILAQSLTLFFPRYGDPSIAGHLWRRVKPDNSDYMEINERNTMKTFSAEELEKYYFWRNIFESRQEVEPKLTKISIKLKPKPNLNINSYTHQYKHQYKNLINFA